MTVSSAPKVDTALMESTKTPVTLATSVISELSLPRILIRFALLVTTAQLVLVFQFAAQKDTTIQMKEVKARTIATLVKLVITALKMTQCLAFVQKVISVRQ